MLQLVLIKLEDTKSNSRYKYIFNLELTEVTTENNPWFLKLEFMPFLCHRYKLDFFFSNKNTHYKGKIEISFAILGGAHNGRCNKFRVCK